MVAAPPDQADLLLHSGSVWTGNPAGGWAQAVAVGQGRIVAVGSDARLRQWLGPHTETIDLRGRTLLPGFQDAHVHVGKGGLDRLRIDLSDLADLEAYRERIADYARRHPEKPWLVGGGWAMGAFPGGRPTAALLDAVVADRPVFLNNRDNHGAWVNSRALELAGISEATPDPPDGRIERDSAGRPTGYLHEGAMGLVARLLPPVEPADLVAALLEGQRYLHSLGITAWQDALVGAYESIPDTFNAYLAIAGDGRLTGRVVGALWWPRGVPAQDWDSLLALLQERRQQTLGTPFRATAVKLMVDGVCETFTAAVLDPYLDPGGRPTANRGISFFSREELLALVPRIDAAGFQVHLHAIGDRACRDALDAIAAARAANGWTETRPHIAHLQLVHPDDRPRFRRLGVTATFQPLWAAHEPQMDELTIPFLGPERASWQYPIGSLHAAGATLAFGSDWPVSSPNPLWEIHVAVNHVMPEAYPYAGPADRQRVFMPEERIDLPTALRAFTAGSAYVNHLDEETGSIEVGKAADLVVLDRDLFEVAPTGIAATQVLLTLVAGRPVYEAPGL
jgi:hypothetical protein